MDKATGAALAEVRWHFGPFQLWETQRRLERAGQAVRLGARSFDLLVQLVRRAGEFVGKDELHTAVWSGVVVEESSVRVHMSILRKALGEPGADDDCKEWITNLPLRGYRFNGRVR
ncbi:winged helix-turn-helix domain-containing protein [Variovorax paradoxus]|uniref:winged helix-turn-helix domain-containing protein n=2 Tax=Variovorax TaxID=34072 RepID=UPI00247944C5